MKFNDSVAIGDICELSFSVDFLKQAESLYNELDLTGRGVWLMLMVEMKTSVILESRCKLSSSNNKYHSTCSDFRLSHKKTQVSAHDLSPCNKSWGQIPSMWTIPETCPRNSNLCGFWGKCLHLSLKTLHVNTSRVLYYELIQGTCWPLVRRFDCVRLYDSQRWLNTSILVCCFVFYHSGKADKHLCEAVLYELNQAVLKTTDDPIRQARQTIAFM